MPVFSVPFSPVVIIEDDPDVGSLLEEVFRSKGFRTVLATTGSEGILAVAEHSPVITTIDVTLPDMDGFDVIRRIRSDSDTNILMVSGHTAQSDILHGMKSGADQYLAKPFRPRELRAGIESLLARPRRQAGTGALADLGRRDEPAGPAASSGSPADVPRSAGPQWSHHRDLSVDLAARTVLVNDTEIELSRNEFDLLATLLDSQRQVRTKADLAFVLGRGRDSRPSSFLHDDDKHNIERHVAQLRRKLDDNGSEPRYIETVRGVGYRLTSALTPVAVAV